MGIALRQLRNPNPLGFPGGVLPGFDPSHVAAKGTIFSGVASGSGFVDILRGKPGTITGTPTASIDGRMGPNTLFLGGTDECSFTGYPTTNFTSVTLAAIVNYNGAGNPYNTAVETASNGGGWFLAHTGSVIRAAAQSVAFIDSTIAIPPANVPFFYAFSTNGVTANFVLVRLDTGQIFSQGGVTSASPSAPNGTTLVGGADTTNRQASGGVATAMFNTRFMSVPELRAWAQDPWAYWYPRRTLNLVGISAAAFKAYWARNSNLPVIGTGNY